jgi:NitT/TauT family transport system substrate-binding protein
MLTSLTRAGALRAGAAIWAAGTLPAPAEAQGLTIIRIGAAMDDSTTPILFADHAGYFKRNGIAVQITKVDSGAAVAAAVAGGSLDLGKASIYAIIAAHARGFPFQLIAATGAYSGSTPDEALIVSADSPIRSAADLDGKILGVASLQDLNMIATEAWVDKNGGHSATLRFIELAPPSVPAALFAGRIAASPVQEPMASTIMATGKARNIGSFFDGVANHYQTAGVFATADWVTRNRDVADRFARAMRDANAYLGKHEDEGVPLIGAFIGITEGENVHHPGRPLYLVASEIQPMIDVAATYKVIAHGFAAQELISPAALKPPR